MKYLPQYIINMINDNKIFYTKHFKDRQKERNLLNINIKEALIKGEVIEYVYRYNVGEKFLIYCNIDNMVFHIVVIVKNRNCLLKTIYIPNHTHFESDNKTRKDKIL